MYYDESYPSDQPREISASVTNGYLDSAEENLAKDDMGNVYDNLVVALRYLEDLDVFIDAPLDKSNADAARTTIGKARRELAKAIALTD